jgi:hypothetical protein
MRARRTWTSIAATSALIIITFAGRAHAQSAEAEALFNDGDKLFKQGKLEQACDAFEASNRIESRAGTLIRLGECREKTNRLASAWSAYKDALTRVKDPRKQKVASERVAALEPRLSHLTVAVPAEARADGLALTRNGKPLDPGLWNRAVPIDGGDYEIAANAPGRVAWQGTATVPIEGGSITISVPALAELPKPVAPPPVATVKPHDEEPPPGMFTTKRTVAVIVLAAGVGAVVTGALLGNSAKTKQHDAYALCSNPAIACPQADQANSLITTGHDRALEADVGFAVGAVAAIIAGTLWFSGAPERPVGVTADVGVHGGGLVVVGHF